MVSFFGFSVYNEQDINCCWLIKKEERPRMEIGIGDYVFHTHCGVCRVEEIAPLSGDDSGMLYFVLRPLYGDEKSTIVRVPLSRSDSLTAPMNKEEALQAVKEWPSTRTYIYVSDSKVRKSAYEASLKSGLVKDLAPLLEGAFQRKLKDGHLNSMDSQFVAKATPIVYGEHAFGLGIDYEDVPEFIRANAKA